VLAVWLFLGLPAGIAMGSYADTTLSEAGHVMGNGNIVVLKPDSWIGKRFPLLEYIDNGERLTRGSWAVLFYHRDCPVCQEAIPRYEACARRSRPEQGDTRIALIEVPPYDRPLSHTPTKGSSCLLGRLDSDHKWFVETPLEVTVDGGVVIRVTKG
jgi:hypothetical protein